MQRVSIIGLGLIGASIAKGLQGKYHVVGYNKTPAVAKKALADGAINEIANTLVEAAKADTIILCTPLETYDSIVSQISDHLQPGTIVTDVGSVKTPCIFSVYNHMPPGVDFVPAHPIAGKETSGYESADGKLFVGKKVILTPLPKNNIESNLAIENMWKDLGSIVETMTAAEHDKIYAYVSHVPQLVAYAYRMAIKHKKYGLVELPIEEGDFATFSRISKSNPALWADIFMQNSANIMKFLEKMFNGLLHVDKFGNLVDMRLELGGEERLPMLSGNVKLDTAGVIFPALLSNLLLICIEDEMENMTTGFSPAQLHQSLAMIEQQVGTKPTARNYADYAGTGLKDFSIFSLYNVKDLVESHHDDVHMLKALVHRKIFEITAAMESDSRDLLEAKLREAL